MPMEDNLMFTKQAMTNKNRVAKVRPECIDIVRSTLRLAGFKQIDGAWFVPEQINTRRIPVLFQKKNKNTWMFNIWFYNQYRRWMRNEKNL